MIAGRLALPAGAALAGALAITLLGGSISRRTAAWLSTLSVFTAFGGAVAAFIGLLGRDPEEREAGHDRLDVARGRRTSTSASRCSSTRSR